MWILKDGPFYLSKFDKNWPEWVCTLDQAKYFKKSIEAIRVKRFLQKQGHNRLVEIVIVDATLIDDPFQSVSEESKNKAMKWIDLILKKRQK